MKRTFTLLIVFFSVIANTYAQKVDLLVGVDLIGGNGTRIGDSFNSPPDGNYKGWEYDTLERFGISSGTVSVYFGASFPVVKLNPDNSFNIHPVFGFGVSEDVYHANLPLFLTYKFGAGATKKSTKRLGFALGVGYRWIGMDAKDAGVFYKVPSALGEFSFEMPNGRIFKVASFVNLKSKYSKQFEIDPKRAYNGDITIKYTFGVTFGYTMGRI